MLYVIDSHCDSIQKLAEGKQPLVNPYNFSKKHPHLQFVALFCGWPKEDSEASYNRAMRYFGHFHIAREKEKDAFVQVRNYSDIEKAFSEGKNAVLLSVEGATGLKGSTDVLRDFYYAGVRVCGLAWLSNDLAKSNRVYENGEEDTGLTDIGREIVKDGNRLGRIWDVSHLSDKSCWDLAELSDKPIIASHSNFRALASHTRNLTDDMAREIIRRGGMIGLNLCTAFIADDKAKQTVSTLFDHLDHCLELGGENNIGFGGDIDGIGSYPAPLTLETSVHDQLIDLMAARGYSDELIEKVAYKNYMSFLKKNL
ncbi:MAG: membrane dipeptidase [Clostridia bacterium]|nr:membrane dipeptidase [Clostridia bacterium]